MASEEGMLTKLAGLFSKKADPKKVVLAIRKHIMAIEDSLGGTEWDLKRESVKLQQTIASGTEAARKGLTGEKVKWATRLKVARLRVSQLAQQQLMLAKSQCLAEMAIVKLQFAGADGPMNGVRDIQGLLGSPKVKDLLFDADVTREIFQAEIERMFGIESGRVEGGEALTMVDDEDIRLFEELAKAEEKGDAKRANEIQSRLTRQTLVAEAPDTY